MFPAEFKQRVVGKRGHGWRSSAAASCTMLGLLLLGVSMPFCVESTTYRVEKTGPIRSIQEALDMVQPGDVIKIGDGNWYEDLETKTDGTASKMITVKGDGGKQNRDNVVLRGAGTTSRLFQVKHDYYTIKGFTINGKVEDEPTDQDEYNELYKNRGGEEYKKGYRDILLYATNGDRIPTTREGGYLSALDGLIVKHMVFKNAGGECVRLKDFVTNAVVRNNWIFTCGLYDFVFDNGGKNGEGVYVGTATDQWGGKYSNEPDKCRGNVVRNNLIMTHANEGVDVKGGSMDTVIEDNDIYMQLDVESGVSGYGSSRLALDVLFHSFPCRSSFTIYNLDMHRLKGINSNGDRSVIRNNYITDASGAGVRVGGETIGGTTYGLDSQVYGNTMERCLSYGVKVMVSPQEKICENDIRLPSGVEEGDYRYSGGRFGNEYPDPRGTCPEAPAPAPTEPDVSDQFVGCFQDVKGSRTMVRGYKSTTNMSNKACIDFCRTKGKKHAGTTNGNECRCTAGTAKMRRNGDSEDCNTPCRGNPHEVCGGTWTVSTYKI